MCKSGFFPLVSTVYFDKKLTNNLRSIGINLIEITRNSKIVNFKNINKENVVGKDITQEKITCDKIVNDIDFKKEVERVIVMKNIKTNWDYSQLAKNYDHRAEYDSSLIKKVLNDFGCNKKFSCCRYWSGNWKAY